MRILVAHNRYKLAGGEDAVVENEVALLRRNGHSVQLFEEDNAAIRSPWNALSAALSCVWSLQAEQRIGAQIRRYQPDVIHVHNFFPKLSPSVHFVAKQCGIPVVQTLHNYRLLCPAATLSRAGFSCEDCLKRLYPWPAVQHRCYRQSRIATVATANMLFVHRICATWQSCVSRFIVLSRFARQKFIAGGLPEERLIVKPNFVSFDVGMRASTGEYALYVGRLSPEKGLTTLLQAWQKLKTDLPLRIVGDGPLASHMPAAIAAQPSIRWLGWRPRSEVFTLMANAKLLIVPSIWYEGFPLVIAEAFAVGLPVIASRIGTLAEAVTHQQTGLLFTPGSADELALAVDWMSTHPEAVDTMRMLARREYEEKYTAGGNYRMLMEIYRSACGEPSPRIEENVLS